jgi:hypothetical protein
VRLQLTALGALLPGALLVGALMLGAPARAEPQGDLATVVVRTSTYVDDDRTAISTSIVSVRARPFGNFFASARYVADAVSSASVDVVTAATGRWTELRSEVLGGAGYTDGTTTLSADYVFSHENDWDSHTISAGGSRDLFKHNLTLGAGASFVDNRVGRAGDDNFGERMRVLGGSLRAVWVAGKRDIFQSSYDLARASGYQSSPYRYAFVEDPSGVPIAFAEVTPELRTRHALTVRWNHHLLRDAALRSHARGYADDWGLRSITAGTELVVGKGPYELAANARLYAQRHAEFYQDVYDRPRRYMTADRELSTFQDVFLGIRGKWSGDTVALDAALTGFAFRFPEFSRLPTRRGFIAALGLVWAL